MERFVIDRFEGAFAVLESEHGGLRSVETRLLPQGTREGDALTEEGGVFHPDPEETRRRQERIRKKMEKLFSKP